MTKEQIKKEIESLGISNAEALLTDDALSLLERSRNSISETNKYDDGQIKELFAVFYQCCVNCDVGSSDMAGLIKLNTDVLGQGTKPIETLIEIYGRDYIQISDFEETIRREIISDFNTDIEEVSEEFVEKVNDSDVNIIKMNYVSVQGRLKTALDKIREYKDQLAAREKENSDLKEEIATLKETINTLQNEAEIGEYKRAVVAAEKEKKEAVAKLKEQLQQATDGQKEFKKTIEEMVSEYLSQKVEELDLPKNSETKSDSRENVSIDTDFLREVEKITRDATNKVLHDLDEYYSKLQSDNRTILRDLEEYHSNMRNDNRTIIRKIDSINYGSVETEPEYYEQPKKMFGAGKKKRV